MEFKKITVADKELMESFLKDDEEYTCETAFANLAMWQPLYNNQYCIEDGILFLKSAFEGGDIFNLPFGDIDRGMELLREYSGEKYPNIWAQQGARFEEFKAKYECFYDITESRNEFDYIYLSSNLSTLSGKKFHSKRNHISSFSKKYNWCYERITADNLQDVKQCAQHWYLENGERMDEELSAEQKGVYMLLDNLQTLDMMGGAIRVDGKIVAFTLGSPINSKVYDIHIEKALPEYATAYTVINREFVAHELKDYTYINRENDLGLEGLRRAKLSYHPDILLQKYCCLKKVDL